LKQRGKVNEIMDWFNTNFYREYGYGGIYPQLFPHHRRQADEAHQATIAWGKQRATGWLQVLNDYWLGPNKPDLCGDKITIANYFGASLLTLGEVNRRDFSAYPNIERWLANMKRLPSWPKVNEALYGFAEAIKGQKFDAISARASTLPSAFGPAPRLSTCLRSLGIVILLGGHPTPRPRK
jgi:glutathione S-transferase